MSRVCQVTKRRPMFGHNVSHSNVKTKRRFEPNLHSKRVWSETENRWVKLRVTPRAMRTIDRKGIDAVLAECNSSSEK